jgi:hypothetical protein
MRKIIDGIAIASGVSVIAILGVGTWGYFWITSEDTQNMLKEKAIDAVKSSLPIPGSLTGPAIPTAKPKLPF